MSIIVRPWIIEGRNGMLRLSKLADYGTVVMVYLARHTDGLCNARDIARNTHLPIATVSKLLKRLTTAGLLVSVRGAAGGYQLKYPAKEISIARIIYVLEEHRGLTECSFHPGECALQGLCHIEGNWRLISQAIESALDSVSLEALAKPSLKTIDLNRIQHLATGVNRGER